MYTGKVYGTGMNKIFSALLAFGMLSASTPAVCHAVMHALSPSRGHTHDGGETSHLHHEEHDHSGDINFLPPALTRRDSATDLAPQAPAGLVPLVPQIPSAFPASSVSGRAAFQEVFRNKSVPQLANIPPPAAAL